MRPKFSSIRGILRILMILRIKGRLLDWKKCFLKRSKNLKILIGLRKIALLWKIILILSKVCRCLILLGQILRMGRIASFSCQTSPTKKNSFFQKFLKTPKSPRKKSQKKWKKKVTLTVFATENSKVINFPQFTIKLLLPLVI